MLRRAASGTYPVPPGRHPPPPARHRRRAPLRRRRRPRRHLRLLPRRPAVPPRGHSPRWSRPILEGRADIVTGTKQGKYEKAFVSRRLQRALPLAVRRAGDRSQLGQGVPPRGHAGRAAPARLASLHGRDRRGRRLPARRRCPVPLYPAAGRRLEVRLAPDSGRRVRPALSVWFQLRFGRKPMLFFGVAGAMLFVDRPSRRASSRWCSGSATASASGRCSTWSRPW